MRLGTVHFHSPPAPPDPQSVSPRGWSSPPNGGTPPRASGPSLPAPSPAPRTQRLTRLCGHLRDAARRGCEPRQGQEHVDTTSQQVQGTKGGASTRPSSSPYSTRDQEALAPARIQSSSIARTGRPRPETASGSTWMTRATRGPGATFPGIDSQNFHLKTDVT